MTEEGGVRKLVTGIPGFDYISDGGLPQGGLTLVAGTAGSAKSVLVTQFLAAGILYRGENAVFVTFEESPADVRRNMRNFGWDIAAWEREGKWRFVDASPDPNDDSMVVGDFDLGALLARIRLAVGAISARRLSVDSLGAIFVQFADGPNLRRELFRLMFGLKGLGVTAMVTAERKSDDAEAEQGLEVFVADNVILMRNTLDEQRRRRTMEILKFRGTPHRKGEYPFTVRSGEGIVVIPLSAMELRQDSSTMRVTTGGADLDAMCGGGLFRDSVVLLSGATGTGKTLLTAQFVAGGVNKGERALLFSFEESRQQLFRNAAAWGIDFARMESEGKLKVLCAYPESDVLEDHLIRIKKAIEDFAPLRVAVDSLSALSRVASARGFREFAIALNAFIKQKELAGLFTSTTASLFGDDFITDPHVATITDAIILLRYVQSHGRIRRGIAVLKMRGSNHDREFREFTITSTGMQVGAPLAASPASGEVVRL